MANSNRRPVSLRVKLAALAVSLVLALVCAEGNAGEIVTIENPR